MKMKISGTHPAMWEEAGYSQAGKRPEEGLGPRAQPWGGSALEKEGVCRGLLRRAGEEEQREAAWGRFRKRGRRARMSGVLLICFSDYSFQRECSQAGVLPSLYGYGFLCEEEIERIGAQLIRSELPAFERKVLERVSCNRRRGFLSCVIHKRSVSYTVIWISHGWSWALLVLKFFPNIKKLLAEFKLCSIKISVLALECI